MSYFNTDTEKWSILSTNNLILKISGENKFDEEKLVNHNGQSIR